MTVISCVSSWNCCFYYDEADLFNQVHRVVAASLASQYKTVCGVRCSLASSLAAKYGPGGSRPLIVLDVDEFAACCDMRIRDGESWMSEAVEEALQDGHRGLVVIEDADHNGPADPAKRVPEWGNALPRGLHYLCFFGTQGLIDPGMVNLSCLDLRPALYMDRDTWRVMVGDRVVHLSPTEFELLWTLALFPGRLVRYGEFGCRSSLAAHIYRLRCKIEDDNKCPGRIKTVRGVGYRFDPV